MSFLKRNKKQKSDKEINGIVQQLRNLGVKLPEISPFVKPLAISIESGIDPEGNKTDYREVASLIESVLIGIAKKHGRNDVETSLREIANQLSSLASDNQGSALGLAMQGELLIEQEKFDEAIDVLSTALKNDPKIAGAKFNLGFAYFARFLKAERMGSRALTAEMISEEKRWKKEQLDNAEKQWRMVLKDEPQNKKVINALDQLNHYRK